MLPTPPTDALDQNLAAKLDTVWGDPTTWVANGLQWLHLRAVRERMNLRVTGDVALDPLHWFFATVKRQQASPMRRVLVLGCGPGELEREIASVGWAEEIVAIDLSAKVLDVARANAAAAGAAVKHVQADMNCLPVGQAGFEPGSFDAVLGVSSVHHCAEVEHLYASVSTLLGPGGWFYLDEYVGPDRFQWPNHQVRMMNQLLDLLPERLRTTGDGRVKGNVWRPSVAEVVAVDPSEAVRSADLLPLLDRYFEIVEQRPYGGAILRVLLSDIAQNFLSAEAEPYLHSLIEAEEDLYRAGRLANELTCVIARVPTAASAPSMPGH